MQIPDNLCTYVSIFLCHDLKLQWYHSYKLKSPSNPEIPPKHECKYLDWETDPSAPIMPSNASSSANKQHNWTANKNVKTMDTNRRWITTGALKSKVNPVIPCFHTPKNQTKSLVPKADILSRFPVPYCCLFYLLPVLILTKVRINNIIWILDW